MSSQSANLKMAETAVTEDRPFKCDQCSKAFIQNYLLKLHLKTVHSDLKPFPCDICPMAFKVKGALNAHMKTHSTELKPFKCHLCPARFLRSSHLIRHAVVHTKERDYECPLCFKKFAMDSNVKRHLKIHADERPFKCMDCDKTFRVSSHLKTHILLIHTKEKKFVCYICKKKFGLKAALKSHMKTHPEFRIQCEMASEMESAIEKAKAAKANKKKTSTTPTISTLLVARQGKSNLDAFSTPTLVMLNTTQRKECGGQSYQDAYTDTIDESWDSDPSEVSMPSTSQQLMIPSTEDNPEINAPRFQCLMCFRFFARKSHLKRHMVTHSDDKPFECEICQKKFSLRDNLMRHNQVHTDERPHECEICSRRFKQSPHLTTHMKIHGIIRVPPKRGRRREDTVAVEEIMDTGIVFTH